MLNSLAHLYSDASAGGNIVPDPGEGGTIDISSKSHALVPATSGTRYMPPSSPPGIVVYVSSTGSLALYARGSEVVDYLYEGDIRGYMSDGAGGWRPLAGSGATQRTASILLAAGGAVPTDLHDPRTRGGRIEGPGTIYAQDSASGALIQGENGTTSNGYGQYVGYRHMLGGQTLNSPLHINHAGESDVAHAVSLYGKAHVVENNQIELFKGTGILVSGDAGEAPSLPTNPVNYVRGNVVQRCFSGIVTTTADAEVFNNTAAIVRDYGCWVKGGNSKVYGNHFWGAGIAAVRLGVDGTSGAMQMDFTDASDAATGCIVSSNVCKITNCYSQGCVTNFQVDGTRTTIANTHVRVSLNSDFNHDDDPLTGISLESTAQSSKIVGCSINMESSGPAAETPNIGLNVTPQNVAISDLSVYGNGVNNIRGVVFDASGLQGGIYTIHAGGFTGTNAYAVEVLNLGDNNTIYVRGMAVEDGTPPADAGAMVKIGAGDWGTNNKIFVNGVELTADSAYPPA